MLAGPPPRGWGFLSGTHLLPRSYVGRDVLICCHQPRAWTEPTLVVTEPHHKCALMTPPSICHFEYALSVLTLMERVGDKFKEPGLQGSDRGGPGVGMSQGFS